MAIQFSAAVRNAMLDAIENAHKVGFTIGDSTGLGHGENPRGAIENVSIRIEQ